MYRITTFLSPKVHGWNSLYAFKKRIHGLFGGCLAKTCQISCSVFVKRVWVLHGLLFEVLTKFKNIQLKLWSILKINYSPGYIVFVLIQFWAHEVQFQSKFGRVTLLFTMLCSLYHWIFSQWQKIRWLLGLMSLLMSWCAVSNCVKQISVMNKFQLIKYQRES